MTQPQQVSFDEYLDIVFASPIWLESCVNMLSVFVEDIDDCRDDPGDKLPNLAPSIVNQVAAVAERAQRLELSLRDTAQKRGPEFQTTELGAILWWAGMAAHKASGALQAARQKMQQKAWLDAFFEIHALLYDTITALSLLSVAEGMVRQMESSGHNGAERPN